MTTIDNATKLLCLERELRMRRRVYPRWVELGKMKMRDAEHEIKTMEAIADDYRNKVERNEPGLFAANGPGAEPGRSD
jgi:hypothetical protein